MRLLPVILCPFCGFSHVFLSLHLVHRPGRRRSRRLTSVILRVRTTGLKRAFYNRLRSFASHLIIVVVSLVFGRRDQCSRRACRHQAGSGSAIQVRVPVGVRMRVQKRDKGSLFGLLRACRTLNFRPGYRNNVIPRPNSRHKMSGRCSAQT